MRNLLRNTLLTLSLGATGAAFASPKCVEPHRMNEFETNGYKACALVYEECLAKPQKPGKFKVGKQASKIDVCSRRENACINKTFKGWLPHEMCKSAGTRFAWETCMEKAIEQVDGKAPTGPRAYLDDFEQNTVDGVIPICAKSSKK